MLKNNENTANNHKYNSSIHFYPRFPIGPDIEIQQ